jgi:hypothetical protein
VPWFQSFRLNGQQILLTVSGLLGIAPSQRLTRQPCPPIGGLLVPQPCR